MSGTRRILGPSMAGLEADRSDRDHPGVRHVGGGYGWYVVPIGWEYALAIWGYALVWFLINDAIKVYVYRMLRRNRC